MGMDMGGRMLKVFSVIIALSGSIFAYAENAKAATNSCCLYFKGSGPATDCRSITSDGTKLKLDPDIFSCSAHKNGTLEVNGVTFDVSYSGGEVVFPTNLVGGEYAETTMTTCPAVDGHASQLIKNFAQNTNDANLCALTGQLNTQTGFGEVLNNKMAVEFKKLDDFKTDLKQQVDAARQNSCCVPIHPDFDAKYTGGNCKLPKANATASAIFTKVLGAGSSGTDYNKIKNFSDWYTSEKLKPTDLLVCGQDLLQLADKGGKDADGVITEAEQEAADNEINKKFALYGIPCSKTVDIVPPSDEYKMMNIGTHFIRDYCQYNQSYTFCVCDGKKAECLPALAIEDSSCSKEAKEKYGDGGICVQKPKLAECDGLQVGKPSEYQGEDFLVPKEVKDLNKIGTLDPKVLLGRFIRAATGIMGSIALAMLVYGGILFMISAGNSERTEKGRSVLVWSSLGLIVILTSYALVNLIFTTF